MANAARLATMLTLSVLAGRSTQEAAEPMTPAVALLMLISMTVAALVARRAKRWWLDQPPRFPQRRPPPGLRRTVVWCDAYPAPSISASGGMLTAHYYHQCSTTAGMTNMYGTIYIVRADGTIISEPRDVVNPTPQRTAAGTVSSRVSSAHGYYHALEVLYLSGNFRSAPANRGRIAGTDTVECRWRSAPIFA